MFEDEFTRYLCFGSLAMSSCVENGVLRGRPYGGLMILVNKDLLKDAEVICAAYRYAIVTAASDLLLHFA